MSASKNEEISDLSREIEIVRRAKGVGHSLPHLPFDPHFVFFFRFDFDLEQG